MLDRSIHPRYWPDQTKGRDKSNTHKAPKPETKQRAITALEAHIGRHPHDNQSASHLSKLIKS